MGCRAPVDDSLLSEASSGLRSVTSVLHTLSRTRRNLRGAFDFDVFASRVFGGFYVCHGRVSFVGPLLDAPVNHTDRPDNRNAIKSHKRKTVEPKTKVPKTRVPKTKAPKIVAPLTETVGTMHAMRDFSKTVVRPASRSFANFGRTQINTLNNLEK